MPFQYTYRLGERDYYEFNRYHMEHTPQMKKQLSIVRFSFPVFLLLCGVIYGQALKAPVIAYTVFGVLALLWLVFYKKLCSRMIKRNMKKLKKQGKLVYDKEIILSFGEKNITELTPESDADFAALAAFLNSKVTAK